MNVEKASVEWHEGKLNDPKLQVIVDELPSIDDLEYAVSADDRIYYGEADGYANFYAWKGPGNNGGYGGRVYTVSLLDGTEQQLKGPFSSRAGYVNANTEFGPVVDANIATDPAVMERGYTWIAGSITLDLAEEAAAMAGVEMQRTERNSDVVYVPTRRGEV